MAMEEVEEDRCRVITGESWALLLLEKVKQIWETIWKVHKVDRLEAERERKQ